VDRELREVGARRFKFLGTLSMIRDWPPAPPVELTPRQQLEVIDIKNARAEPGDHEQKDLGEIATVIVACDDGRAPVVSDDGLAKSLCAVRGMKRLTTSDVLNEMSAALPA
jgi:predicted nucleic acid-binding protein